jgi:hypothetical protein
MHAACAHTPTCAPPPGLLDAALAHDGCSLVLTTYEQLRLQRDLLLPVRWGVAVLDEGHKIRNPDAEVRVWEHVCVCVCVRARVQTACMCMRGPTDTGTAPCFNHARPLLAPRCR